MRTGKLCNFTIIHMPGGTINTLVISNGDANDVLLWMFCPETLNLPLILRLHLWVLALPLSVHLLRNAGSIEDEMKLLQNKKLTERQQAAAQLRFSEKVILQKTLDAVRRWVLFAQHLHECLCTLQWLHAWEHFATNIRLDICLSSYNMCVLRPQTLHKDHWLVIVKRACL